MRTRTARTLVTSAVCGALVAGALAAAASGAPAAPDAGRRGDAAVRPDVRTADPPYASSVRKARKADARTWRRGCPVHRRDLRVVTVRHWGYDRKAHDGTLVVNRDVVRDVRRAFRRVYAKRFPIKQMRNVDEYGGKDRRSMRDDNTSAYNCRRVAGSSSWSNHAYGRAIDINPRRNPYVWSGGFSPKNGRKYLDRSNHRKGMIGPRSVVVRAFTARGWQWGGAWRSPDYQHVDRPR